MAQAVRGLGGAMSRRVAAIRWLGTAAVVVAGGLAAMGVRHVMDHDHRQAIEARLKDVMLTCGVTHTEPSHAQYPLGAVLRMQEGRAPTLVCISNAQPQEAAGRLAGRLPEQARWWSWHGRGHLNVDGIQWAELTDVDVLRARPSDTCVATVRRHVDDGAKLAMVSRVVFGRAVGKVGDKDYQRHGVLGVHMDHYLPGLLLAIVSKQAEGQRAPDNSL